MSLAPAVALVYGTLSLFAFGAFGLDKLLAKRGSRRIPEARLHLVTLLGGFPGAWLGRRVFRHKTQKPVFGVVALLALLLHGAGWIAWWYLRRTGAA